MYYEEKVINGILHYRSSPDAPWTPFTKEELTRIIEAQKLELSRFREQLNNKQDLIDTIKETIQKYQSDSY